MSLRTWEVRYFIAGQEDLQLETVDAINVIYEDGSARFMVTDTEGRPVVKRVLSNVQDLLLVD